MLHVHPLLMGTLASDSLPSDPEQRRKQPTDFPSIIWHVHGAPEPLLVDMSFSDDKFIEDKYNWKVERLANQTLDGNLVKYGLRAADVRTVIVTHLHWDHIGLGKKFRNAIFIVQKRELEAAKAASKPALSGYDPDTLDGLDFRVIDGDSRISRDIKLLFTPGHTVGHQSVVIKAQKRRVVIAGDAVMKYDHWKNNIAPPFSASSEEALKSLRRLKKIANIILPGHDLKVVTRKSYP